ncbi:MAG: MerR family transcriptional regulator [Clostridia bacterium]|nr:MerR family transcriptional regulator [Clostridia bacterium]
MRYSIGDVSRVLGMTTSALHFYEKEGIINTPKEESGRRYYEEADVTRLFSTRKYRAMGVPVRDIAKQFSDDGMSGEEVAARMRERRDDALRAIRQYEGLVRDLDDLIETIEDGLEHTNMVDIRRAEDMIMLKSSSGSRIPLNKGEQRIMQRWLEAMPAVSLAICREETMDRAVPALVVSAARARELGLEADDRMIVRIPGGMALHAVVTCGEEQYETPDVIFKPLLAFARDHRFTQRGTMWGRMIVVDCRDGRRRHYYETYMYFK